jgi:hypothetical protein
MSADTVLAMVLGIVLLVLVLGGVVWLDVGPVGRYGRSLQDRQRSAEPREPQVPERSRDAR